ncbi:Acyl carrier protein [Kitasatospora sp. MMS16-BH015]|uniref:acyl carrier protein n=1 Tax=Kitasatospora sp. MMS16-BH015 TaxID=2018025 RepID=UPI000CA3BF83|nr:acyl carrier protein [Kitasatospora sp. MMS16-BH015]AUG78817.1 Acyl carrier protein [Kitasatospora sp. MMS16-BH015]
MSITTEEFVQLVNEDIGLQVEPTELEADFDALPGWDSLHLLKLVTALEKATGRKVPVGRLLEARSLGQIHRLATAS